MNNFVEAEKRFLLFAVMCFFFTFFSMYSQKLAAATIVPYEGKNSFEEINNEPLEDLDQSKWKMSGRLRTKLAKSDSSELVNVLVSLTLPEKAAAFEKAVGPFQVRREFRIVNGFAATMTKAQAEALAKNPKVKLVDEDGNITTYMNDPEADFGVDNAKLIGGGLTGSGVNICFTDTGLDINHSEFDPANFLDFCSLYVDGCTVGPGGTTSSSPPVFWPSGSSSGHGTLVASIAVGQTVGVAPEAGYAFAQATQADGSELDSGMIAAIEWCAAHSNIDIISISIGTDTYGPFDGTDLLSQAANCAVNPASCGSGYTPKIVVAAAGNRGPVMDQIGAPAAAPDVVTVGAVHYMSDDYNSAFGGRGGIAIANFSSRGGTISGDKPDIMAPGVNLLGAIAGTTSSIGRESGTSLAAPFVAGVAALAKEAVPSLSPSDFKTHLINTAQDRMGPGFDIDSGNGLLDATALIQSVMGVAETPHIFPVREYVTGEIPDGESLWEYPFTVYDSTKPVTATLIIGGEWTCVWQELIPFFNVRPCSTDPADGGSAGIELDMEIDIPGDPLDDSYIDRSACPGDTFPYCGYWTSLLSGDPYDTTGRGETVFIPNPTLSEYVLRVYRGPHPITMTTVPGYVTFEVELQNAGSGGGSNTEPAANEDTENTDEDNSVFVDVLGNDSDPDGDTLSLVSCDNDGSTQGIVTISGDSCSYNPAGNFDTLQIGESDIDTFNYTISDGELTDTGQVTVTVNGVNDAPVAQDDSATTDEGVSVTIFVLNNDSDPDSPLVINSFTDPPNGSVVKNLDNSFTYTPDPGVNSLDDTFDYTIGDSFADSTATVTVTINPSTGSNDPPVAAFNWECNGTNCTFTNTSYDTDGTIESYAWDFGDGQTSSLLNPSHTYNRQGTKSVRLTVVDDGFASAQVSTDCRVTKNKNTSGSASSGGSDTTPPAAPTGLTATAGDGNVSLDWDDNGETDFASYSVHRSTSAGGSYSEVASGLGDSSFVDGGLTNGTTYFYVVTAFDTSGNESASSSEASATPTGGGGGGGDSFCDTRPNHKRCQ